MTEDTYAERVALPAQAGRAGVADRQESRVRAPLDRTSRVLRGRIAERIARLLTGATLLAVILATAFVLGFVLVKGAAAIDWTFLTVKTREGGILQPLLGTVFLVLGTAAAAIPIAVLSGIYLSEYAARSRTTRIIRISIANMAGVPSVVFGLFGLAAFSIALGFKQSVLAGSLTLACLTLPVVITATEEALRQVPQELRQASLALGASKLRTVFRIAVPAAAPGIVTGSILGLARAAGETAPILFTAAAFLAPVPQSPLEPTMALPYHLFIQATQVPHPDQNQIWGSALVLIALVSIANALAAAWRSRQRRRITW